MGLFITLLLIAAAASVLAALSSLTRFRIVNTGAWLQFVIFTCGADLGCLSMLWSCTGLESELSREVGRISGIAASMSGVVVQKKVKKEEAKKDGAEAKKDGAEAKKDGTEAKKDGPEAKEDETEEVVRFDEVAHLSLRCQQWSSRYKGVSFLGVDLSAGQLKGYILLLLTQPVLALVQNAWDFAIANFGI